MQNMDTNNSGIADLLVHVDDLNEMLHQRLMSQEDWKTSHLN